MNETLTGTPTQAEIEPANNGNEGDAKHPKGA